MYVCVCMGIHVYVYVLWVYLYHVCECLWRPENLQVLLSGDTGSHKLPDMVPRTKIQALWETVRSHNH